MPPVDDRDTFTPQQQWRADMVKRYPELFSAGVVSIPNGLIDFRAELGITPTEFVYLNHLFSFTDGGKPGKETRATFRIAELARRTGHREETVKRTLKRLEQKGLLQKIINPEPLLIPPFLMYSLEPLLLRIAEIEIEIEIEGEGGDKDE